MYYTYSWRDGTQELPSLDPDDVMEELSDDLMSDGDLPSALARLTRGGLPGEAENPVAGTGSLLDSVRSQRRAELEKYGLDSMMHDVQERIAQILGAERAGLERRRNEVNGPEGWASEAGRDALEAILDRRAEALLQVPQELGSAFAALAEYEFVDETARAGFDDLVHALQHQVIQTQFSSMRQSMDGVTPADIADFTEALRTLNGLIEQRDSSHPSEFDHFRESFGSHFPPATNLDELVTRLGEQAAQMESLLCGMSPDLRQALEGAMGPALRDASLQEEMARLHLLLEPLAAERIPVSRHPVATRPSLTCDEVLDCMRRLKALDELEMQLREANEAANVARVDARLVQDLLGSAAHSSLQALQSLNTVLAEAGYLDSTGENLQLTPRGIRRIGQKALRDVFRGVKRSTFGEHAVAAPGVGTDISAQSRLYAFGDPFLLDLGRTIMNAIQRSAPADGLKLSLTDFEVFGTEDVSQAATVLIVDMSGSMPLRGCFAAAKKVALALHTLISSTYPRDLLYVLGFSDYAVQLHPQSLYRLTMNDQVRGTNIQHGLMMARRLLAGHKIGTRQIILITDGEPTAHVEDGRLHFSYPPSSRTVQATLREVQRCTRENIVINTFMLEHGHYLADFVHQITRLNGGRVLFATPERLGEYVLLDYVQGRRTRA